MKYISISHLSKLSCIYLASINGLIALTVLQLNQDIHTIYLIAIASFLIFVVLLWNKFDNILFFARTLILGGIGYFPMIVKVILGPYAFFSGYEKRTQGIDIVILMYVATSLAILGNEIGLYWGGRGRRPLQKPFPPEGSFWKIIFVLSIPIIIWASVESILSAGGESVFTASYASLIGQEMVLGNTIATGIICLLAMWVALLKQPIKFGQPIFISLAILFLGYSQLLMGYRQDVLTPLLGMAVCYALVKNTTFKLKPKMILIILLLVIVFEMWGLARQIIAVMRSSLIDIAVGVFTSFFNPDTVQFGTVSPIATTFSNTVWLLENKVMDFAWGRSYWEFILRTPPAFLYPDRPIDYAWIFGEYGLQAGGGFFELAEAYMNFGLVGALLVPMIISFFLSKAFHNTWRKQTVLSYFLLFTFLGVFFRGTWYQTFAFYKAFLTIFILYAIFRLFYLFLTGLRGNYRSLHLSKMNSSLRYKPVSEKTGHPD